jgi:hypothetical protein
MMVRILLSVIVLLAYNGQATAQDNTQYERTCSSDLFNNPDFDKECFLIGTLNDYMGHQQTFTVKTDIDSGFIKAYTAEQLITPDSSYYRMVDTYFQQEEKIALLIFSLFRDEYPDLNKRKGKLYSATLSKIVDGYFDYQPSGLRTIHLDTIYRGCLIKDKIATHKQKTSFLMGAFLRNGTSINSKEYVLSIPNSAGKAGLCEEILKEFDCKNVVYTIYKDYIPVGHKISFEPSEKVSKIMQTAHRLLNNLDETQ